MGCIYYRKDVAVKRWRVMIRHLGFKSISRSFYTKKEAKEFLKKAQNIINNKIKERDNKKALEGLKRDL